jgi:hypothetical protein
MNRLLLPLALLLVACPGKPGDTAAVPVDLDHDGYTTDVDCDDEDANVHPGAEERCNDVDDDCDGYIDDDDPGVTGRLSMAMDADGDSYGSMDERDHDAFCTEPGEGWVSAERATDCDDDDPAVHPGADEHCNGYDDDCDGDVDEDGALDSPWYLDADGDGWGDTDLVLVQCEQPEGYVLEDRDCDDGDPAVHPGAEEHCDGVDEDCDTAIDNDAVDATTWYHDLDGDGWGDSAETRATCQQPSGYVAQAGDCDDGDGTVNPGASEHCDGVDEDCDGATDEDAVDAPGWHPDSDGDGYGDAAITTVACTQPGGSIANGTDCDDGDAGVHPGASEVCNGVDDDCDGAVDEGAGGSTWYRDGDGDGYGSAGLSTTSCTQPTGYVASSSDCDDADASVHPGATELCNQQDDDCDGSVDGPGLAAYAHASGATTDMSATLASGTASAPYAGTVSSDGTLYLCDGSWYATLTIETPDFALVGLEGSGATALAGDGGSSIISAGASASLINLTGVTLSDGAAVDGGCVYGSDHGVDLVVDDLVLSGCSASGDGGGLFLDGGTLVASSLTIEDCDAGSQGGGLFVMDSAVSVDDSSFEANEVAYSGGGLYVEAPVSMTLDSVSIVDNIAGTYGGGAYIRDALGTLVDLSITGNSATYAGGIILNDSAVTLQSVEISANQASAAGGGVYVTAGLVDLLDSVVSGNEVGGGVIGSDTVGGGLFLNNGATVTCTGTASGSYGIYTNTAGFGGGGFIYDTASIFESVSCDWGTGSGDNAPDDFAVLPGFQSYTSYGPNEDFVCTGTSCF